MKLILIIHAAIGLSLTLLLWILVGRTAALSLAGGAGVMMFNLISLVITWPRLLRKKQVALSIGVIVFKFAILAWIIYEVVSGGLAHLGWFSVGLATVVPTAVVSALSLQTKSQKA